MDQIGERLYRTHAGSTPIRKAVADEVVRIVGLRRGAADALR